MQVIGAACQLIDFMEEGVLSILSLSLSLSLSLILSLSLSLILSLSLFHSLSLSFSLSLSPSLPLPMRRSPVRASALLSRAYARARDVRIHPLLMRTARRRLTALHFGEHCAQAARRAGRVA